MLSSTAEHSRLEQDRQKQALWKKWGPYLSERQWGTVREDCSVNGDALLLHCGTGETQS